MTHTGIFNFFLTTREKATQLVSSQDTAKQDNNNLLCAFTELKLATLKVGLKKSSIEGVLRLLDYQVYNERIGVEPNELSLIYV